MYYQYKCIEYSSSSSYIRLKLTLDLNLSDKNIFFISISMKDLLDKFFDLCREYQEEIPPQKMAEVLREYADRLDEWWICLLYTSDAADE